ncbi:apoptosis-inducing factor 3-like isoform X3 [Alligator sinensis]|uniref:Apoptosis-inducing factor 3-like isoform X3 n=1 Tax=Alligator sinensis TaxID=38654 RepID=A0A3Q0HEL9_ALLSI|nr:apoptosis-inducing factor 3-like isoform X3 [Alligator sinensis]
MEVASFLSDKASTISVVEKEAVPFQEALGPQVGGVAMKMLQGRGVKFYMKSQVSELRGEDGKVSPGRPRPRPLSERAARVLRDTGVGIPGGRAGPQLAAASSQVAEAILDSGKKLPADVVVVGIGVSPASEFLKGSPFALDSRGAVLVDLLMKTNVSRVFAAGDVAAFPVTLLGGERIGIYHWQVAQAHGHVAALSMLKKQSPLHTVPFFWTVLLGSSIRYAGCGKGFTETVVKGSLEEQKFVIFYIKDGYVTAVASLKCDPMVVMVAEALYAGKVISKEEAEGSWTAWLEMSQTESK